MTDLVKLNSEVGAKALEIAQQRFTHRRETYVVEQVETLLKSLHEAQQTKLRAEQCITFYEAKIAAVQAGEFSLNRNDEFRYNNEKLNSPSPNADGQ